MSEIRRMRARYKALPAHNSTILDWRTLVHPHHKMIELCRPHYSTEPPCSNTSSVFCVGREDLDVIDGPTGPLLDWGREPWADKKPCRHSGQTWVTKEQEGLRASCPIEESVKHSDRTEPEKAS
jgi:hypothetical protein